MDTSLRYGGSSNLNRSLRLHAKEKLQVDPNTFLQIHGELDTQVGAPNYFAAILRYFDPKSSADLGLGVQFSKQEKFKYGYTVRGKKAFAITTSGSLSFNIKGRCDTDREFKQKKGRGAAELNWNILNFTEEQDVRFRLGYEIFNRGAPNLHSLWITGMGFGIPATAKELTSVPEDGIHRLHV